MAAKGGGRTRDSPSRTRGDRQGAAETHNEGSEQHMLLFMPDIRRMAEALGTAYLLSNTGQSEQLDRR